MSIPNVESAEPAAAEEGKEAGGDGGGDGDDGFTPEERRKNVLEEDQDFIKYVKMYRMKIPLHNIRGKVRDDPKYEQSDIDLFASEEERKDADYMLIWNIYIISN